MPRSWLGLLFGWLMGLYPRRYRDTFRSEMQDVFRQAYADASQDSEIQTVRLVWRELRDLPGSLLRAYWMDLREALMSERTYPVASWGQAALAGLPHVLTGLAVSLPTLLFVLGGSMPVLGNEKDAYFMVTDLLFAVLILCMFLLAWRRGWPRWSASLYGYGFIILAVAAMGFLSQLQFEAFSVVYWLGVIFFLLIISSLVSLLIILSFRRPIRSLLFVLPLEFLLWQVILEFTSPLGRTAAILLASLAVALAAVWILRRGDLQNGLLVVLGASLLVGLLYATARTYFVNHEAYAFLSPGGLADLAERLILPFAALSTIVLGPFLLRALRLNAEQAGQKNSFRLVFIGCVLELVGVLFAHLWLQMNHDQIRDLGLPDKPGQVAAWVSYLGAGLILVGAGRLLLLIRQRQAWPKAAWIGLLGLLLGTLPALVVLPLAFGYRDIPAAMPFAMRWLQDQPVLLVYTLASSWVILAAWMAVKFAEPDGKQDGTPDVEPVSGAQTESAYSSPAR